VRPLYSSCGFGGQARGELLTKITIPPAQGDGFASVTIGREGTCIVNAAATRNGETRFAIGCVAAVPVTSLDDLEPPSDVHGSADYRRHLAKILSTARSRRPTDERRGHGQRRDL
jgi:CO/xanthine dehydrogenase FAD-binding subunit